MPLANFTLHTLRDRAKWHPRTASLRNLTSSMMLLVGMILPPGRKSVAGLPLHAAPVVHEKQNAITLSREVLRMICSEE
jgi:hypothetical protein